MKEELLTLISLPSKGNLARLINLHVIYRFTLLELISQKNKQQQRVNVKLRKSELLNGALKFQGKLNFIYTLTMIQKNAPTFCTIN